MAVGNQFKRLLLKSLAYFIKLKDFALFAIPLSDSFVFLSVNLLPGIYSFQVFFLPSHSLLSFTFSFQRKASLGQIYEKNFKSHKQVLTHVLVCHSPPQTPTPGNQRPPQIPNPGNQNLP